MHTGKGAAASLRALRRVKVISLDVAGTLIRHREPICETYASALRSDKLQPESVCKKCATRPIYKSSSFYVFSFKNSTWSWQLRAAHAPVVGVVGRVENCIAAETLPRCGLGKREPAATALPAAVTVLAGGATQAGTV